MADLLRHPLVVLLATALLTGILVPVITRRWQDRQKELEIKAELVSQLSETIMKIVMAVQFAEIRAGLAPSRTAGKDAAARQEELDEAYRTWEIESAVLGTKLEAYFAHTSIPRDWTYFSDVVTRFYALLATSGAARQQAVDELRREIAASTTGQPVGEGWAGLRDAVLGMKGDVIRRVLSSDILIFRPGLFRPMERPGVRRSDEGEGPT